jgi:hypothetical protein
LEALIGVFMFLGGMARSGILPVLLKNTGEKEAGCSGAAFQELLAEALEYYGRRIGVQLMRIHIKSILYQLSKAGYALTSRIILIWF